jgi:hypothetical protein
MTDASTADTEYPAYTMKLTKRGWGVYIHCYPEEDETLLVSVTSFQDAVEAVSSRVYKGQNVVIQANCEAIEKIGASVSDTTDNWSTKPVALSNIRVNKEIEQQ